MTSRKALTLIELLVVLAIFAVMIGLLLPAIQSVRLAAQNAKMSNQMRQINVAYANYVGSIQTLHAGAGSTLNSLQQYMRGPEGVDEGNGLYVDTYINSADISYIPRSAYMGNCSIALNHMLLDSKLKPHQIPDGSSHTVLIGERYTNCNRAYAIWTMDKRKCWDTSTSPQTQIPCNSPNTPYNDGVRTPAFADANLGDVVPIRMPGNRTDGSVPGVTFQYRVSVPDCDSRVLQASFPGGLIVGLADGSIRAVAPRVSPAVFWSAVTPAGGESLGDW